VPLAVPRKVTISPAAGVIGAQENAAAAGGSQMTSVRALSSSLDRSGSVTPLPTRAVLVRGPATGGAVTRMAISGAGPTGSSLREQRTTPPAWLQSQPLPEASIKATPAGRVSVTETEVATVGPALATARV